ncbi:conserved domain protein [delta proteobacterium NaphS2]|nr:conserved domain protein [delta proteobacterium NaphS2]
MELIEKVKTQVEKLGADIEEIVEIETIRLTDRIKTIKTEDCFYEAKAVILATGREPKKLSLETDCKQIYYCAICDGSIYKGRNVLVVGGGNSGVDDSLWDRSQRPRFSRMLLRWMMMGIFWPMKRCVQMQLVFLSPEMYAGKNTGRSRPL